MAYYEIIFGSGCYECFRYVIQTEESTTDYGALVDVLIDYLEEQNSYSLLDMENEYYWIDDENIGEIEHEGIIIYPDEYVIGGNHGRVLLHHGTFRINEITEKEVGDAECISC